MWHGRYLGVVFYPVLSWTGIMCVGYAFGPLANITARHAVRHFLTGGLGLLFLAAFSVMRLINGYGDSYHFLHLGSFSHTAMSFFEVQKYPPSLDYVLATFGVLLLLYTGFDVLVSRNLLVRARGIVEVYGRVPFFYYVQHIYLIHAAALVSGVALGASWRDYTSTEKLFLGDFPPVGHSLPVVYVVWLCVIVALYPGCLWFSRFRARRRDWWLSYL